MRHLLPFALAGCTLGLNPPNPCETDQQCQAVFGDDYSCNINTGYCDIAVFQHPRCTPFPADLFDAWADYEDVTVVGAMVDGRSRPADLEAIEMALNEVDGSDRTTVALVCDHQSDVESNQYDGLDAQAAVVDLATYLGVNLNAPVVVGPSYGSVTLPAYEALSDRGAALLSPTAGDVSLDELGGIQFSDAEPGLFWRTVGSGESQMAGLREYFRFHLLANRVAILHDEGVSTDFFALEEALEAESINVEIGAAADSFASEDFAVEAGGAFFAWMISGEYDAVILLSDDPTVNSGWLNGIRSSDFYDTFVATNTSLFFGPNALTDAWVQGVPSDFGIPLHGFGHGLPSGSAQSDFPDFNYRYTEATGRDAEVDTSAAYAYDAMMLALYGVTWSQEREDAMSGAGVARGFRAMAGAGDGLALTGANLGVARDKFASGEEINIYGASGPLEYDLDSQELSSHTDIWTINAISGTKYVLFQCTETGCESPN